MTRKRTSENDLSLSAGASAASSRRKTVSRTRTKYVAPETPSPSAAEPEIAVPQAVAATPEFPPDHHDIARLAFLYWEGRGYQGGSAEEDWLRAEQELKSRAKVTAQVPSQPKRIVD